MTPQYRKAFVASLFIMFATGILLGRLWVTRPKPTTISWTNKPTMTQVFNVLNDSLFILVGEEIHITTLASTLRQKLEFEDSTIVDTIYTKKGIKIRSRFYASYQINVNSQQPIWQDTINKYYWTRQEAESALCQLYQHKQDSLCGK